MAKPTTLTAGIDTAKDKLDAAIPGVAVTLSVPNDKTGWKKLARIFAKHKVGRIGIEATGGYERGVVRALQAASSPHRSSAMRDWVGRNAILLGNAGIGWPQTPYCSFLLSRIAQARCGLLA